MKALRRNDVTVIYRTALVAKRYAGPVTLDASAPFDPDEDEITFAWDQIGGPPISLNGAESQSDKTAESLVELDRELRDILGPRPATDDELDKVKKNAILQLPGRFETKSSLRGALSRIWMFDLSPDYWETYAGEVRAITLDDIQRVARDVIRPDQMVWVVVGDRAQVESGLKELEFGELTLIDTDGNPVK